MSDATISVGSHTEMRDMDIPDFESDDEYRAPLRRAVSCRSCGHVWIDWIVDGHAEWECPECGEDDSEEI